MSIDPNVRETGTGIPGESAETMLVPPLWKTVWQLLTKLNLLQQPHPAVTPLGIHPKSLKTDVHTATCTWIFRAGLFRICPNLETTRSRLQ